ncbi:abortive infection system toxin AbiGii family protein [Lapidilactobacillus wuchangensis]|uniref:abortive infection system toxin AbiGii family protein n=1 Tax=Lapidilactobacillus wuchangensis TaxID=2486001 RepID=UPI0013DE3C4F|nr:abortive infection system toxin AbiGii family protein [Lapidilactobacillus wuchangensis]
MTRNKFGEAFSKSNSEMRAIPKPLVKYIKQQAPTDYTYNQVGKTDLFTLNRKEAISKDTVSFDVKIQFPFSFEGLNVTSMDELLNAMYRVQKPYKLDQKIQQTLGVPNVKSVYSKIENQLIYPMEFPEMPPIVIKAYNHSMKIPVKRVPYADYEKIKIESTGSTIFNINLILNENINKFNLVIDINFGKLRTIDDYFRFRNFIKALYWGDLYVWGIQVKSKRDVAKKKKIFQENDKLYSALKLIQNKINMKIDFPQKILVEDVDVIKVLFESLINERSIKGKPSGLITLNYGKQAKVNDIIEKKDKDRMNFFIYANKKKILFTKILNIMEYKLVTDVALAAIDQSNRKMTIRSNSKSEIYFYWQLESANTQFTDKDMVEKCKDAISFDDCDFEILGNR